MINRTNLNYPVDIIIIIWPVFQSTILYVCIHAYNVICATRVFIYIFSTKYVMCKWKYLLPCTYLRLTEKPAYANKINHTNTVTLYKLHLIKQFCFILVQHFIISLNTDVKKKCI
jgi:hypothetical protein